jgi:hypothetical protein
VQDPTKVDRSGAYIARQAAKSVVAAGLARRCLVQVSYAIGVPEPLSVFVDSYGTGTISDADILAKVGARVGEQGSNRAPQACSTHMPGTVGVWGTGLARLQRTCHAQSSLPWARCVRCR